MTANKRKQTKLVDAFRYAGEGIVETFKREKNMRVELFFALFAIALSVILQLEPLEWAIIIILIVLVLMFELINSALESLVDLVSPEQHPLAKQTKDAMAGAVLVASIGAAVCGLILFVHAAIRLWGS